MTRLFTASDMHKILCKANGLEETSERALLTRVRYMAKRGLLHGGKAIDDRGTWAFRAIEIYRCAILAELAGIAMDVRAFQSIFEAAGRGFPMGRLAAPSMTQDGLIRSQGGLIDAINGVSANERWSLQIELRRSGMLTPEGMFAEFIWEGATDRAPEANEAEQNLNQQPVRTRVSVDLFLLFKPLIEIVGVPENAQ